MGELSLSGGVAAVVVVVVDAIGRARWGADGPLAHMLAAGTAFGAAGVLAAAAFALVAGGPSPARTPHLEGDWLSRSDLWVAALVAAPVAAALSGVIVRAPVFGVSLTGHLSVALPAVGFLGAAAAVVAWRATARRARRSVWFTAHTLASVGLAVALLLADARVLRGRHTGLHLAIELVAFALLAAAILRAARRSERVRLAAPIVGAVALAGSVALLGSRERRDARVMSLRHLSADPSTTGILYTRALRVVARPEAAPPPDAEVSVWAGGEPETADQAAALVRARTACAECNVVVFFVDTLRADTARDPAVMPAVSKFMDASIRFPKAYSTASDTLGALSTALSGRYDGKPERGLLRQVRARGLDNALFISRSAHDFLTQQLPEFRFDEEVTIVDTSEDFTVWGYGADVPTGHVVTQRALSWIRERRDRRFFTWLYNFDLHAWRQLREEDLRPRFREDPRRPEKRYRAVARMVDKSFRDLLEGLDALGVSDRTVVLLVSDHGEALGYRGFWMHSTFLWESLVRVPLALRVPGLEPREIAPSASLIDLAPTLARFVDPFLETTGYHGLDLLRFYVDPEDDRTLPLLLQASNQGKPTQYGAVSGARKLVVASEGGPPLLHDLSGDDPDDTDLALAEPDVTADLLDQLNASPLVAPAP